jgi:hypothetical protein
VHCAKTSGSACARSDHARPDLLPDEPGGYDGFQGLFGAKYVDPVISSNGPLTDLDGKPITDPAGNPGFPGFDGMSASVSLGWVAAMQEHGIPITYAYISDAHDLHTPDPATDTVSNSAQGPGEAGYVQQLRAYDQAFAKFFQRLQGDGITPENTEFVFTVEEGDHFVGGQPANPGCDGVTTPCQWSHVSCVTGCPSNDIGEINANLRGLLATQRGNTTPFDVHADMAPGVYLHGNPARDAAVTRTFERDTGALTATDPYTGRTEPVTDKLVDQVGMRTLHMITGDPLRTPTFVDFLDPDYFGFAAAADCATPCVSVQPGFAWNHGGIAPEIATTWAGFVGPGFRRLGQTGRPAPDHAQLARAARRLHPRRPGHHRAVPSPRPAAEPAGERRHRPPPGRRLQADQRALRRPRRGHDRGLDRGPARRRRHLPAAGAGVGAPDRRPRRGGRGDPAAAGGGGLRRSAGGRAARGAADPPGGEAA